LLGQVSQVRLSRAILLLLQPHRRPESSDKRSKRTSHLLRELCESTLSVRYSRPIRHWSRDRCAVYSLDSRSRRIPVSVRERFECTALDKRTRWTPVSLRPSFLEWRSSVS